MMLPPVLATTWVIIEYLTKIAALGTAPESRRPSSLITWLLLIFLLLLVGLLFYLLIDNPWVHGARRHQQHTANEITPDYIRSTPDPPKGARSSTYLAGALCMSHRPADLPCASGEVVAVHTNPRNTYEAMARVIDSATDHTHVEFYIMSWNEVINVFFAALGRTVTRGITVHPPPDHLGSRRCPGWKQFCQHIIDTGTHWRLMVPLLPLRRRWHRPDLHNHRKILVINGERSFIGSHNAIDPFYRIRHNMRAGHRREGPLVEITGEIVLEAQAVPAMDWLFEASEQFEALDLALGMPTETLPEVAGLPEILVDTSALRPGRPGAVISAMQLAPSGPGYPTEPNLRMFLTLIHGAKRYVSIINPCSILDEALLTAMTSVAYRGVKAELFMGKESDQFIISHTQRSCYSTLLATGVQIHPYPSPIILHLRYMVANDEVGVIGSSNTDFRFLAFNYKVILLIFGGDPDDLLRNNDAAYRTACTKLAPELWVTGSWYNRYVGNAYRLTSAVL